MLRLPIKRLLVGDYEFMTTSKKKKVFKNIKQENICIDNRNRKNIVANNWVLPKPLGYMWKKHNILLP